MYLYKSKERRYKINLSVVIDLMHPFESYYPFISVIFFVSYIVCMGSYMRINIKYDTTAHRHIRVCITSYTNNMKLRRTNASNSSIYKSVEPIDIYIWTVNSISGFSFEFHRQRIPLVVAALVFVCMTFASVIFSI